MMIVKVRSFSALNGWLTNQMAVNTEINTKTIIGLLGSFSH